ncbi:MAG: antibiotic biosynthesis monooxygenase [Bacteroidota bacterium]
MTANKFTVIYSFILHEGKSAEFIHAWTELTKLIYQYEGSYGSCLHRASDTLYIGYAQWPSREQWEQSGSHLPESADELRTSMRSCCVKIQTEHELAVVSDLLHDSLFSE